MSQHQGIDSIFKMSPYISAWSDKILRTQISTYVEVTLITMAYLKLQGLYLYRVRSV